MILNNMAIQNESTLNPLTISVHKRMISALMTKRKRPNVKIVTGSVSNTKTGLRKMLSNPRTQATMTEVVKLTTCTPGIKCAMHNTSTAVIRIRRSVFIAQI